MENRQTKGYIAIKILLIDGEILRRWTPVLNNFDWTPVFDLGLKLDRGDLVNYVRSRTTIRFNLKKPLDLEKHFKSSYFSCNVSSGPEEVFVEGRIENLEVVKDAVSFKEENVIHYVKKKEFSLRLTPIESRKLSFGILCYEELEDGTKNLYHTEIPPNFRGLGLGRVLAEKALSDLSSSKIRLTCDYLLHLYSKHKHEMFKEIIVIS